MLTGESTLKGEKEIYVKHNPQNSENARQKRKTNMHLRKCAQTRLEGKCLHPENARQNEDTPQKTCAQKKHTPQKTRAKLEHTPHKNDL